MTSIAGNDYKIVYVLNGYKRFWRQLMVSMLTLKQFIHDNIVVFYVPPRFQDHIDWLESRSSVYLVETPLNSPDFRERRVYYKNKTYEQTMKLHAYTVNTSTMIHLDCGTIIHGDFLELLDDDFDLLVAREEAMWGDIWMDGFYIFKNHTYLDFLPIYRSYLMRVLSGELKPFYRSYVNITAFNLAIESFIEAGFKVKTMHPSYYTFARPGKYVQHLRHEEIATWIESKIFSEAENHLKEIGGE